MQTRELKRLLDVLKDTDVSELTLETGEYKLTLKRGIGAPRPQLVAASQGAATSPAADPAEQPAAQRSQQESPAQAGGERLVEVVAPIVGTFYAAPSPDAPPFVRVGDRVSPGTVLCIIEAMKLMNEIEAETSGVVREVLVDNGQPVEYGQTLFRIEPD